MSPPPRSRQDVTLDPADLRAAIDAGAIEVRYQPIVRIADRRPVGLEALARLQHPTLGLLQPDQFVPQIEAAGLASHFTKLVSAQVFADLCGQGLAGTGLRIAVNFPLEVLLRPADLDQLEQQRAAAGVPADRIIIELTETQPVQDLVGLRQAVTRLRRIGYGVAIDDVGPAVPHLEPLLTLPFSSLKLDKVLVSRADTDPEVLQYLTGIVQEARRHLLSVVAEGVETEAIWTRMQAIGVDYVQGFLAARPLPRTAVPVWLRAWPEPGA